MQNNIVFVSNCDLYKDLINSLLGKESKFISYSFSCCDAANLLQSERIKIFILAHEFIEDSIEDYQDYLKLYEDNCTLKPILLCDEFEIDEARLALEEKLVKDIIVARPLEDADKLISPLKQAISQREITKPLITKDKQSFDTVARNNRPSILVIEDDDFFTDVYKMSLRELDMEITVVSDCSSASDAIYLNKPSLIFLDYNLPDFNGFEFLQSIKSDPSLCDVPVIVVTGDSDPELNKRSRQIGATKFLKKPINANQIITIANAVMREKRLVNT